MRVLIVDDERMNRDILSRAFPEYDILLASNSREAQEHLANATIDVVLLDIMMPDMDGYEVCRRLKMDERLAEIPVIFISALTEPLDKVKAFAIGGVDYLTKPFHMEELQELIEVLLADDWHDQVSVDKKLH